MANTAFGAAFDKALRAFQTGGITYNDFLGEIDAQMEGGASVSELLDVLWRREQIEPLPPQVHGIVIARIEKPLRQSMAGASPETTDDVAEQPLVETPEAAEPPAADDLIFSWDTAPIALSPAERADLAKLADGQRAAESEKSPAAAQEPAKAVEIPKPLDVTKPAEAPKLTEAPKPTETPKPTAVVKPATLPKAADAAKAVSTTAPLEVLPERAATTQLADAPKPATVPKPLDVQKRADAAKPPDSPRRLADSIARELRDWLSRARPTTVERPSVPPPPTKPEPRPSVAPPPLTKPEPRPYVPPPPPPAPPPLTKPKPTVKVPIVKVPTVNAPIVNVQTVKVPQFDTPRVTARNVELPVLEALRVSTARAEAPTVVLGDRTGPPVVAQSMPSTSEFFDGRFRLIEQVADSEMSRVYRAEDVMVPKAERRTVALKVFKRHVAGDANALSVIQNEFSRLRALVHPNIVQMIECGVGDGTLFVTMEWLTGVSLYRRLDALAARHELRGLPAREAQKVIGSISAALEYAHARGVIHGDLKPGNVFLGSDGTVKLIDFGMSTWLTRGPLASAAPVAATPRYASPQLMARQGVGEADDVYAFACVVYEIMSGRYPFVGAGGVEDARFVPLRRREFTTPQYAALLNGLAPDAAQRVPSVREFMQQFAGGGRARRASVIRWAAIVLLAATGGWLVYSTGLWKDVEALSRLPPPSASAANTAAEHATLRDCQTCPLMVVIPAGRFVQDLPNAGANAAPGKRPQHTVVIARPFAIAANDVTVGDYQAFVAATRRDVRGCDVYDGSWRHRIVATFKDPGFTQAADHPATCVSWNDALAYADWLTQTTGHTYRLPSAAEWEYAARAGGTASAPWETDGNACAVANVADRSAAERYKRWNVFACSDGFVYTAPGSAFPANAFGVHDMLGNVLEWTLDCWQANYAGAPADGSARGGRDRDCRQHEVRGASWFSAPSDARISRREHYAAAYRISTTGMRVVRQLDQ